MPPPQLRCFGTLGLEGPTPSKVASKHLLLLAYTLLEGPRSRFELAGLFWSHLVDSYTAKGERKDLSNLGVARAVLKREAGVDITSSAQLTALDCDVKRFEAALKDGAFEDALYLYRRGVFLEGVEDKSRLKLGSELYGWLGDKRIQLSALALEALTQLALQPAKRERVRNYTEEMFRLGRSNSDPGLQGQLYTLLSQLGSPLKGEAQAAFGALADEYLGAVSPEALRLYLALALQGETNLAAAQIAADLSPKAGAVCAEALRGAKLLSAANKPVDPDLVRHYFERHPEEKMPLLSRLRDHTPTEQAHAIYEAIYTLNGTFGGVGYWQEARDAYAHKAVALIQNGAFGAAAAILEQLQEAEQQSQQTPNPATRFLQAYVLERLRRYQQGLAVLEGTEPTPEITAISAALLSRTSNFQEAKKLAQQVKSLSPSSPRMFWAKAIALNTLGQIAYEENSLLEAELCFAQATIQWALAGHPQRELGALMNRANVLEELGRTREAQKVYEEVLEKCGQDDVLRVRTLLNLGYLYEDFGAWPQAYAFYQQAHTISETRGLKDKDLALAAAVYTNLGHSQWQLGFEGAHANLRYATNLALQAGERSLYAVALSNLALIEGDLAKFATALELLEQLGSQRELRYYGELFEQLLRARTEEAKEIQDTKSLRFLEETFASFRRAEE